MSNQRHRRIYEFAVDAVVFLQTEFRIFHVPLKLIAEVADCCRYRPCCRIAERADGIAFYLFGYVYQQVYVVHLTMAILQAVENFLHPAGAFAARAALSAGFVMVEAGKCIGIAHNALIFVVNDKAT